jgi:hypothetical protein
VKKIMVGTTVGVKKSLHSILSTRDDRDLNKSEGRTKNDDESSNEDDDFEYNSNPDYDTIDFSNWNTKNDVDKLMERRNGNVNNDDDVNNDDYSSNQSSVYSRNAIQEEMEREAMSVGMRSKGKRFRVNNEENSTAHEEKIWRNTPHATGSTSRISTG